MGRVAVLIDTENIAVDHAETIFDYARRQGDPTIVRLYGDFTRNGSTAWLDVARSGGYGTVLQLSGGKGKNSTDIALVIDAMDILFAGVTDTFCLASDDRDFVPLVVRLRAAGKRVHVICKTADPRLGEICSGVRPLVVEPPIVQAFRQIAEGGTQMPLIQVAQLLRRHVPELIPPGPGKVRKALRDSGWFAEEGKGDALMVVLRRPAA